MRTQSKAAVILATILFAATATPALAQADSAEKNFDIQQQSLATALNEFARQSDRQILFSTEVATAKRTEGVKGELQPEAALRQLLKGTGLTYRITADNTILVENTQAGAATDVAALPSALLRLAQDQSAQQSDSTSGQSAEEKNNPQSPGKDLRNDTVRDLEEIIVTAQKRQERLIDVPQSVSVLSADTLARLDATQFRDFANAVPGLIFKTSGAGMNQVSLRGVTTGQDSSATVGIYVDEVPYGSSTPFAFGGRFALDVGLFDIEQIGVLRGPQGTLYGASSLGGLLKYVTRQPDASAFGVDARTGISSTQGGGINYNAAITVNAPLAPDSAALRMSGFYSHDGGYIDNVAPAREDVNRAGIYGGRADLLLTPSDEFSVRLVAFAQNIARDGEASADYDFTGAPISGDLKQRRGFSDSLDQRFRLLSATAAYNFAAATLTSISSYQTVRSEWIVDATESFGALFGFGAFADAVILTTDKFTQEVRLASSDSDRLEWVLGGFYTNEKSRDREEFVLRDLAGQPALNTLFTFSLPTKYEEYAAFGNLTWHFTEKFAVGAGLRYAPNRQSFHQTASGAFAVNPPPLRSSEDVLTYLANARYHFSERTMGYVRFATGYRPGGPTIVTISDPASARSFDADRLESYEIGIRSETVDRHFSIDLAAFHIDWNDMQTFTTTADGFGTFVNTTTPATIDGAELALTARPIAGFTASAALAYQDAKVTDDDTVLGAIDGERLPNVPRFAATLSADYELPVGTVRPTVGGTLRHVSDRTVSFDLNPNFAQYDLPEYTSVDLRTGARLGSADIQLYVHNLFDERGELSATTQFFKPQVAILQPRTIGISLSTRF